MKKFKIKNYNLMGNADIPMTNVYLQLFSFSFDGVQNVSAQFNVFAKKADIGNVNKTIDLINLQFQNTEKRQELVDNINTQNKAINKIFYDFLKQAPLNIDGTLYYNNSRNIDFSNTALYDQEEN